MAKLINEGTPEAGISGKIGNIVIVRGKTGPYIRKRPHKNCRLQNSESARQAKCRFSIAAKFINRAARIVRLGTWPGLSPAVSQALSVVLNQALGGSRNEYFIDYSKVLLSDGTADLPKRMDVQYLPGGKIVFDYEPLVDMEVQQELIVALYSPITGCWDMMKGAWPGTGKFCFKSAGFDVLEVYYFLRYADGSNASRSVYLGSLSSSANLSVKV